MSKRVLFNGALFKMYDIGIDEVIIQKGDVTMKVVKEDCLELLKRDDVPAEVVNDVKEFFAERENGLSSYEVLTIRRASEHPEDNYLYHVAAKKGDTFACWTCWNENTKSLNYGHYGLVSEKVAMDILDEYYHELKEQK